MYRLIVTLALVHSALISYSQKILYYDRFFLNISEKETPYTRTFEDGDGVITFTELSNDSLVGKGYVKAGKYGAKANDLVDFVRKGGAASALKKEFKFMQCEMDFYLKGKRSFRRVSHSGKVFTAQVWSDEGDEVLVNGTGTYIQTKHDERTHEIYADSILTEAYQVRLAQQDTIYRTYDAMAQPHNGYEAFMKDLSEIMNYPALARIVGKQGVVYVAFIVDKAGKLTEFKPLTREGLHLEQSVERALEQMRPWKPATFRGKAIKMKFVLPVRFKLK